ncbi:MAG: phage portal protein [Pirellulales bacterium]
MTPSIEHQLQEVFDTLWDDFVDPREAYTDVDGQWWTPIDSGSGTTRLAVPVNEAQLRELRNQCRRLATTNEFAINGHENRVSYIVGAGHSYRATVCKGMDAEPTLALAVQKTLERFLRENHWHERQQEIVRRMDRDGEAFLRFFVGHDGLTRVRFIEPDQVAEPTGMTNDRVTNDGYQSRLRSSFDIRHSSFGIQTEPHDVESVVGYWVDGELVDAADVQHRRANVDFNVKRGLPLYTPVRKNLRRAEKLLRNMSVVAEIQSAIALIRKHRGASRSGIETFVANNAQFVAAGADAAVTTANGRTRHVSQYGPGTILDAPAGLEYDFPTAGVDAGSFVTILQAELRSIAARLVMPEFMFTSDASNANFASTMIAEGPAVRMFERLQANLIQQDREVMWRVVHNAIDAGVLPPAASDSIEIQITPPSLKVRDALREAQVDRIAHTHGILSAQSWSQHLGLDYDQEQKNFAEHSGPRE